MQKLLIVNPKEWISLEVSMYWSVLYMSSAVLCSALAHQPVPWSQNQQQVRCQEFLFSASTYKDLDFRIDGQSEGQLICGKFKLINVIECNWHSCQFLGG